MRLVIVKRSRKGYVETVEALVAAIERRGLTLFARIDHTAAAREVGLELADEEVVLFGNPRGGTPLMQSRGAQLSAYTSETCVESVQVAADAFLAAPFFLRFGLRGGFTTGLDTPGAALAAALGATSGAA